MRSIEKTCECGKTFMTYPSVDKRHCSRACSSRFVPRRKRTGETVACAVCGKDFYRNPTAAKKGHGRYCSAACHNLAQAKDAVVKACVRCGTAMRLSPSEGARQFCSKACESLDRIKRPLDRTHNGKPVRLDSKGYVLLWEPSHPKRGFGGWHHEHRLVIERALGRILTADEQVDHINSVKDDNRLENLQVLTASEHGVKTHAFHRTVLEVLRAEVAEYRRRYGPLESER